MVTAKNRAGNSVHKTMRFDPQTIKDIKKTGRNLKLNFSRTTEFLVKLGLQYSHKHASELDYEMQRVIVAQGVNRALNRYLRLLSQATIAANEAKEMAQQVFFRQLCQLADQVEDVDEIDPALTLLPGEDDLHAALVTLYQERQAQGHTRAVKRLLQTVQIDEATWQTVLHWDEGRPSENELDNESHAAIRQIVEQTVSQSLSRYLKLLVRTVLAATEAQEMAQQMFFAHLCGLSGQLTDATEVNHALTLYPSEAVDNALIELYRQRQKRGRNRSVRSLKKAIDVDSDTWKQILQQVAQA